MAVSVLYLCLILCQFCVNVESDENAEIKVQLLELQNNQRATILELKNLKSVVKQQSGWIQHQKDMIEQQQQTIQQHNFRMSELETIVKKSTNVVTELENKFTMLRQENIIIMKNVSNNAKILDECLTKIDRLNNEQRAEARFETVAEEMHPYVTNNGFSLSKRNSNIHTRRQIAGGISFTAYLDHDVDSAAALQPIIFDKVITNDGNGYNIQTGTFTCAEEGVYMFSFFVGERNHNEIRARLVVNNAEEVDAISEPVHNLQDVQGGNMAVIRLKTGDEVWVEFVAANQHVEGAATFRLSSFTGVYLYY